MKCCRSQALLNRHSHSTAYNSLLQADNGCAVHQVEGNDSAAVREGRGEGRGRGGAGREARRGAGGGGRECTTPTILMYIMYDVTCLFKV